jgi:rubrerythrin
MDYMASLIEKIIIERNQKVDNAILGEIRQIAIEEGIETKIALNQKAIVDALRKQIPTKPDYEGNGYDDRGNLIYDTWICPNCGDRYEVDYEYYRHCPMCGQLIDWSEEGGE